MLTVRLDEQLEGRLDSIARARGRTRSELVREVLEQYVERDAYLAECRRQSLLACHSASEQDELDWIEAVQDEGEP